MRLLLSAPCGAPRFVGEQLLAAARRLGHDASLFDHPASRDPTLELPDAAARLRPEAVLLVEVEREDPATIDVLRAGGAWVGAWLAPVPEGTPGWRRARRTWIAGAADAVFVTSVDEVAGRRDRSGRPAQVVERGFDPETLGVTPGGTARDGAVALRAADDPLREATGPLVGLGAAAAFPKDVPVEPLPEAREFGARVAGHVYVAGARASGDGPPSVFDDVAAARAAGCRVERGGVDAADAVGERGAGGTFEQRLRELLAAGGLT